MRKTSCYGRFFDPAVIFALLLSLASGSAFAAQSGQERLPHDGLKVRKAVKLQPQPEAEVTIPQLKALFLSDGSVTLSGHGTVDARAPMHGYDFEVDLTRGTYTTRRLDQREIEERDRLQGSPRKEQPVHRSREESLEKATVYCARVRVRTEDPAFIDLTETMTRLSWTISSTGALTSTYAADSCWAANPSSLGTHWYTNYCTYGGLYTSSGRLCNDNRGDYYNYDFVFDDLITTANQYVYVCGRNDARYDYSWSHNDAGEGALLIFGSVVLGCS